MNAGSDGAPETTPVAYPATDPYDRGMLDVGDGNRLYWELSGNRHGTPAVYNHGGPGAGLSADFRRFFDPSRYHLLLYDQRNCGRSTPHAAWPEVDLTANTTQHLVGDLERLRQHFGFDTWVVGGGSWGSALSLAYAEAHPDRVLSLIVRAVFTSRYSEFDWLFRGGLSRFLPGEWNDLVSAIPRGASDRDIVETYYRALFSPDVELRTAATAGWSMWESATPHWPPRHGLDPKYLDQDYALAFARLVTHYVHHYAWLDDGALIAGARALRHIPGVLINGQIDLQTPPGNAWELARAWEQAELVIVDGAGHYPTDAVVREIVRATDRVAGLRT